MAGSCLDAHCLENSQDHSGEADCVGLYLLSFAQRQACREEGGSEDGPFFRNRCNGDTFPILTDHQAFNMAPTLGRMVCNPKIPHVCKEERMGDDVLDP